MPDNVFPVVLLLAVGGAQATELPPHPRLLFSADGVAQLKQKIACSTWARAAADELLQSAESLVNKEVKLPARGGNWYHYYACPVHGERLKEGRRTGPWQWEHICPVDGEILKGDPIDPSRDYDGCAIGSLHQWWSRSVRDLGVAYQISGDRRFAAKAREVLLAYANAYASYPLHNTQGKPKLGGGRIGCQSLDESVWLIPVCQGTDLIWDTLCEDERRQIADRLLLPAVRTVILPHRLGIHNIQCWKNSAVGLVGFLLGDTDLIDAAIDDPDRGYRVQMARGVTADGAWWEGAWGYHFYTMNAVWPLVEAARNCGMQLYGPEYRRMFDAPLKFAMPNLRLPAFNDSGEADLGKSSGIYELGYARYHDEAYLKLIKCTKRDNDYAFWFGEPELSDAPRQDRKSANYPASGYAVLTRGSGEKATWLCFKYGPYGGGHGHPDRLSFVLYSRGRVIAVDPGTALYGLPIQTGWFKTSLAHNTLIVDEQSQKAVDGNLISFGSRKGVDYVVADAGDIYDGVRYVRTIALLDQDMVAVIDQVSSDEPRTLDIAYHQHGQWTDLAMGERWSSPDKPGYSHLQNGTIRGLTGTANLATRLEDGRQVAVTVDVGSAKADLITADGVTSGTQARVPCAIVRHKGTRLSVGWAVALDGKAARVERLAAAEGTTDLPAAEFRIVSAEGRTWHLGGGAAPVK